MPVFASEPISRPTNGSAANAATTELTIAGAPEGDITAVARQEGMLTLREDGLRKVRSGVTSIAEVARVAS